MRKIIIISLFFLFTLHSFSQFRIEKTQLDTFYILKKLDTLKSTKLPNGKWKYYYPTDNENKRVEFNIKNNLINGEFKYYENEVLQIQGFYHSDSLWTFYSSKGIKEDTMFRVGIWFFKSAFSWVEKEYKKPFDKNGNFQEVLTNNRNEVELIYKWNEKIGKVQETRFRNGIKSYEYIKTENFIITTNWTEEGKIASIDIEQDSIRYNLNIEKTERFYDNSGFYLYKMESNEEKPIIQILNNKQNIEQVNIFETDFILQYIDNKGKKKYKRIK